jgi:Domain of unknown function (DUF5615)
MRFLADENFPGSAVATLSDAGHDVIWIRNAAPGLGDKAILAWAARENRVLLTFDKDFGEIARNTVLPKLCGVILFRMPMPQAKDSGARLTETIASRQDWAGHPSIVEPGQIRMRALKTA